jgi:hypothetical protein
MLRAPGARVVYFVAADAAGAPALFVTGCTRQKA